VAFPYLKRACKKAEEGILQGQVAIGQGGMAVN